MGGTWTQLLPPSPHFTEPDLPSLAGRVFLVTGGNAGIGLEVVKLLYAKGGTVYIAARSLVKIAAAIEQIKSLPTSTPGLLRSLYVDLGDLTTIHQCVTAFASQESRLDVLFNNAGISQVSAGSMSVQGYEAHMGTNCLGPYLLTKLLLPIIIKTASTHPRGSVRIVYASSSIVDMAGPPGGLLLVEHTSGKHCQDKAQNYSSSKAGNWFMAAELDREVRKYGIISLAQNPGNLRTKGWDNVSWLIRLIMRPFIFDVKMGAYTTLWAGLSPDVHCEYGGRFAFPWGRWHPQPRKDVLESLKSKDEGGTGLAADFVRWCDEQTRPYAGG